MWATPNMQTQDTQIDTAAHFERNRWSCDTATALLTIHDEICLLLLIPIDVCGAGSATDSVLSFQWMNAGRNSY